MTDGAIKVKVVIRVRVLYNVRLQATSISPAIHSLFSTSCHCYRDADDAVYARDGYDYDGYKLRVEFPRGGGGSFRGGRGDRGGSGGRRGGPARRSQYRVLVTGTKKAP